MSPKAKSAGKKATATRIRGVLPRVPLREHPEEKHAARRNVPKAPAALSSTTGTPHPCTARPR